MKKEKKCWICRRNVDELVKDLEYHMDTFGVPVKERKDYVLIDSEIGDQEVCYCQGCNTILYNLVRAWRHKTLWDEEDIALLGDLDNLKVNIEVRNPEER